MVSSFLRTVLLGAATLSAAGALPFSGRVAPAPPRPETDAVGPPNIVLLLADDQGWNALSAPMDPDVANSRSDFYRTPSIDALMRDGMRFRRGYAPAPVCSPTRHSILWGISPAKLRVTSNSSAARQHCDPELSLPSLIKKADARYVTAHFGKWHISIPPDECGYDESDGATGNRTGNPSDQPEDPKRAYEVTARAVDFIERQVAAERPFFVQVSHYADHAKVAASPGMRAKYDSIPRGKRHSDVEFAAMNEDLDAGVGRVLETLDRLRIADRTYVIYLADNGFFDGRGAKVRAWPLSYSKGYVYEGGIRVPFIVRGPDIDAGVVSSVPVIGYDLLPTVLDWINPEFEVPAVVEGGSLAPVLAHGGQGTVDRPNDFFVFHFPIGMWPSQTALIRGDLKLVKTWAYDRSALFDLENDISEQRDLSRRRADDSVELNALLTQYLESVDATVPPESELAFDRTGPLMKVGAAHRELDPDEDPEDADDADADPQETFKRKRKASRDDT